MTKRSTKRLTTGEFILRARKVHGDKYNYSLTDYQNARSTVTIVCSTHGEFEQTPNNHLSGSACSKCSGTNKKITTDEFIKRARKVHGNKYNYSESDYNGAFKKLTIICPIHGTFEQKPSVHTHGSGCHKCAVLVRAKARWQD